MTGCNIYLCVRILIPIWWTWNYCFYLEKALDFVRVLNLVNDHVRRCYVFVLVKKGKCFPLLIKRKNTFLLWRLIFSLTRIYFLWLTFPMFTKYRKVKKMVFRNLFSWKQTRHKYIWLEKNIKSLFFSVFLIILIY